MQPLYEGHDCTVMANAPKLVHDRISSCMSFRRITDVLWHCFSGPECVIAPVLMINGVFCCGGLCLLWEGPVEVVKVGRGHFHNCNCSRKETKTDSIMSEMLVAN